MFIDVTQSLTDLDGNTLKPTPGSDDPLTLRFVCTHALLAPRQSDAQLPAADKMKRFLLAQRIHTTDSLELSAEDVVLLKSLINETFIVLVAAKSSLILDPAT